MILPTRSCPGATKVFLLLISTAILAGCASFGPVRSAEVIPGSSVGARASLAAPPGDDAAWFWSFDCATECNQSLPGFELDYTYGVIPDDGGRPYEIGAGVSGILYPFVHGYLQLEGGERPFGVGARIGVPITGWQQYQLFARYDVPIGGENRLLLDPTVFLHAGRAPNGENPGTFLGLVPAIGLELRGRYVTLLPSASLVAGWTHRETFGGTTTSSFTAFPTVSVGVVVHGEQS